VAYRRAEKGPVGGRRGHTRRGRSNWASPLGAIRRVFFSGDRCHWYNFGYTPGSFVLRVELCIGHSRGSSPCSNVGLVGLLRLFSRPLW